MRGLALFVAAGVVLASGQAYADLIGTNVDVLYLGPDAATTIVDLNTGAPHTPVVVGSGLEYDGNPADVGLGTYNSAAGQIGVSINITGTQIIITNLQGGVPFCSTTPCADTFNGFKFIFSNFAAGVHITGVTTDAATPADFQPTNPATSDASDVLVNLLNDDPVTGDQLTLDVALSSPDHNGGGHNGGGGSVPEPASLVMLASALLMLSGFAAWRRRVTRQ